MTNNPEPWIPTPAQEQNPGMAKRLRWLLRRALVPPSRFFVRHFRQHSLNLLLTQRILEPDLRWRDREFLATTVFGAKMSLDTRDIIQRYLYIFGIWEPNITHWMRRRLKPGDVLLDIGANVGYYTLLGAQLVGSEGRVVAFEPSPTIRARLMRNIELNKLDNVEVLGYAVSSERGSIPFYMGPAESVGMASTIPREELRYEGMVECYPLDELVAPELWKRTRLVKVDVEGAEFEVVKSLIPMLAEAKPELEIYVEISPQWMESGSDGALSLMSMLAEQGYNPYYLPNDYGCISYATDLPVAKPRRFDGEIEGQLDIVFSKVDADYL